MSSSHKKNKNKSNGNGHQNSSLLPQSFPQARREDDSFSHNNNRAYGRPTGVDRDKNNILSTDQYGGGYEATNNNIKNERLIRLVSMDGVEFDVPASIAAMSVMIKDIIDCLESDSDNDDEDEYDANDDISDKFSKLSINNKSMIKLPKVRSKCLEKVIEFCTYYVTVEPCQILESLCSPSSTTSENFDQTHKQSKSKKSSRNSGNRNIQKEKDFCTNLEEIISQPFYLEFLRSLSSFSSTTNKNVTTEDTVLAEKLKTPSTSIPSDDVNDEQQQHKPNHGGGKKEKNENILYELVSVANYLNIPPLLDLLCLEVTLRLYGKSAEQIRSTLNIPKMSDEEEERAREEHAWIFP